MIKTRSIFKLKLILGLGCGQLLLPPVIKLQEHLQCGIIDLQYKSRILLIWLPRCFLGLRLRVLRLRALSFTHNARTCMSKKDFDPHRIPHSFKNKPITKMKLILSLSTNLTLYVYAALNRCVFFADYCRWNAWHLQL